MAVAIAACLPPHAVAADPVTTQEAVVSFDIPAGDLSVALERFSTQSGIQAMYREDLVAGKRSQVAVGSLPPSVALARLLAGTGLVSERVNDKTYVLREQKSAPKQVPKKSKRTSVSPAAHEKVTTLSEILVLGSNSLNVDNRRTREDVQPYVVFEREQIERSMASNIEEFLMTRLPMNQTRGTKSRNSPGSDEGNRSGFNLRGLGENQTLILINGRRAPGVSTLKSGNLAQPDLNGIPLAAVERIEVLPTTASGIYGGGATGGVINVILRKDYIGSEVQLTHDNSFDTDSARNRIDFSTGLSLEGGKTHVMVSGSYSDGNDLLVRDRDYAQRGRNLLMQNDPLAIVRARLTGTVTNIYNSTSAPLVLKDGTSLGSNVASVPVGYRGGDGGVGLLAGAGLTNIEIPNTLAGGRQSLSAVPTTSSINLTVRRDFNDAVEGYIEYGNYKNESISRWSGFGSAVSLPASAPANPFRTNVLVAFPQTGEEIVSTNVTVSKSERLNTGLIIKLPANWSASLDLNWTKSTNVTESLGSRVDATAVGDAIRSGALQVLRDLTLFPLDLSPYVVSNADTYGPSEGSLNEYAIRLAGPLMQLPAGEAQMAALISKRGEQAESTIGVIKSQFLGASASLSNTEYRYFPSRSQDVRSIYVETSFPLVSEAQQIPLVRHLELQASVRRDEYRTSSVPTSLRISLPSPDSPVPDIAYTFSELASTDYTVGFKFRPFTDLALRASYGTGFLAPSLAQVSYEEFEVPLIFLNDPKRGGVGTFTGPLIQRVGGSSDVKPEHSESFSAGLIYTPAFVPGLRISADYTQIDKTDEITNLTAQQLLDLEDSLPGRVIRGPNLPGDPSGYAGAITLLDVTLFNTATSRMEAVDFQVDYDRDLGEWGEIQAYGVATLQNTLESQIVWTAPVVDRVGYNNGPLRWRGNFGMAWKKGAWNASFNTQWYDSYYVMSTTQSAAARATVVLGQGTDRIASQSYTDIYGRYTVQGEFLKGLQLSAGIRNVFDAMPPTLATADPRGGYSTYGDPRGRTYVISLKKSF